MKGEDLFVNILMFMVKMFWAGAGVSLIVDSVKYFWFRP